MAGPSRARSFFDDYTRDLKSSDIERMFTREAPEAYRYFARHLDFAALADLPWYKRWPEYLHRFFVAFAMKLSPARRILFAVALVMYVFGMLSLFRGFSVGHVLFFPFTIPLPLPQWVPGTFWLVFAFCAANLLILLEVADRMTLKSELEIARDIQQAMLPSGIRHAGDAVVAGLTRPANTVGGDFYDILERPDGRLVIALGDVAGKGSPAALLMALLLAMMRTLIDEGLEGARLIARLNAQVVRHSPPSRFITFFYGLYDPRDGRLLYVNAGHLPPILRRADGRFERVGADHGGLALGMFDHAEYEAHETTIDPGDMLVLYTDGITEAETPGGRPFEESGLEAVLAAEASADPEAIAKIIFRSVEAHADQAKLGDDLTVLVLKRRA
jgi:serine phosphatase RsbU (regulator of sigma subunit)